MAKKRSGKTLKTTYQDVIALARRRGILYPSYEIYGGVAGFYDWGPVGTSIKKNFLAIWRESYVEGEGFYEIDCPNITPEEVFRASGHLGEFTDYMTKCADCGQHYRADHLVSEVHANPDTLNGEELDDLIKMSNIRCPECIGPLSLVYSFNLMFKTNIGPTSDRPGYLRPETAQGMFLNFRNLFYHNRQKLPLGIVQIGKGFRNEISPRQGVIRVREFNMAELELFVDPEETRYVNYPRLKGERLRLLPDRPKKEVLVRTVEEALKENILNSEILAYFVALTNEILVKAGIDPGRLRFRQHERHEMAHYAKDCWDAEALTDFGWVELVGIADRSCYDVEQHMKYSGVDLRAMRQLSEPKNQKIKKIEPDMKMLGPVFKQDAGKVRQALLDLDPERMERILPGADFEIEIEGDTFSITSDMYDMVEKEEKITIERFIPHVIEPSYGIDRILYAVLEHSLEKSVDKTGEEIRTLRLPSTMAPFKYAVFPLMSKDGLVIFAKDLFASIRHDLSGRGYLGFYDGSGSIGRRYSRMDEIGTPYCITVDYDSLQDGTVTVRERDSKDQVRMHGGTIGPSLLYLMEKNMTLRDWAEENGMKIISRDE